jgi:hypothetical protein
LKYIKSAYQRVLEALLVSTAVSLVAFSLPYIMRFDCSDIPSRGSYVKNSLRTFTCPAGQYSGAAVLFFNPAEQAIKVMAVPAHLLCIHLHRFRFQSVSLPFLNFLQYPDFAGLHGALLSAFLLDLWSLDSKVLVVILRSFSSRVNDIFSKVVYSCLIY